jgi:hypothetical protein
MADEWEPYWLAKAEEHYANGKIVLSWAVLFLNYKPANEGEVKWRT